MDDLVRNIKIILEYISSRSKYDDLMSFEKQMVLLSLNNTEDRSNSKATLWWR